MLAFKTGAPHAGAHPLDDEAALELGNSADDDDDSPAQRAGRVDALPERDELYLQVVQLVEHGEKMARASSYPIIGPDQDYIEAAAASISHHGIESWSLCLRSADPVCELCYYFVAALRSHLAQVVQLRFRVLINGRDPHIKDACASYASLLVAR
jgi:hypothetical protein